MNLIHCKEINLVFHQSNPKYPVGFQYEQRITYEYEFDYILSSNQGKMITEGIETPVSPGMFFVRKPGTRVQGVYHYTSWFMRFQTTDELNIPFSYCVIPPEICGPIFQKIYDLHIERPNDYSYYIDYHINTLIFLLYQEWECKRKQAIQNHPIAEIHDIMEKNWKKNDSLDYYVGLSGYSKSRFCHLFQEIYHTPPMHFLHELRLQNLCLQLIETERPVKELMLDHGYTNEQSFFRHFKARTGETPQSYRQKHRF